MGLSKFIKSLATGIPQERLPDEQKSVTEPIEGYKLKYHYHSVEGTRLGEIPDWAKIGNRVIFIHETNDEFHPNAIRLLLVPQRKYFGYMRENKIKEMVIDYLKSGDKIVARISSFEKLKYEYIVKIDIAFFKKVK